MDCQSNHFEVIWFLIYLYFVRVFFVRNILGSGEFNHQQNDYVAYHYKQKIFYLPANGMYMKMNDFGFTIIANELEPNDYNLTKMENKYHHKNPFNQKTDIFNLLHDSLRRIMK